MMDPTADRRSDPAVLAAPAPAQPVRWPDWVPEAARAYLEHTSAGNSLRAIARRKGVHPSTILRQVRRFESRRDDPLVDRALGRLQPMTDSAPPLAAAQEPPMSMHSPRAPEGQAVMPGEALLLAEARRLLPLLAAPDTVLAVAADMDRAVILREAPGGAERLGVLERGVAEAFALRDWIACCKPGRVARYALAPEGRAMLRRLGLAPARPRPAAGAEDDGDARFRPPPESPVSILARRRDPEGRPFLAPDLVAAAEQLREDYEVAQVEPAHGAGQGQGAGQGSAQGAGGPEALDRVLAGRLRPRPPARLEAALADLGPGLGDVALRCCCWQEGVETAEQKLGWSARSGKIVLRIALERLARHYAAQGEAGKMVG